MVKRSYLCFLVLSSGHDDQTNDTLKDTHRILSLTRQFVKGTPCVG